MNNGDNTQVTKILTVFLSIMFVLLLVLVVIYITVRLKQRMEKKNSKKSDYKKSEDGYKKDTYVDKSYSKQSILDFMEFDDIQDNMIIQKKGKRFLMIVECQGVNYDLMSQMEKVGVEEGFQQFLNTLRSPIQLYIQTRSVNLESSIATYKARLRIIENQLNKVKYQYDQMVQNGTYTESQLKMQNYNIRKQQNLYEYAKDIISNTEKMNKNKNILSKQYYVIIPYYPEEDDKYDKEEIQNMAFSELYTKAQSVIRALSACSVVGKILNSKQLVDLLYVAYNRDEAEAFGIDRALEAGYNELYSTSQDVFEKKIKVLDEMIEDRAIEIANDSVEKAKSTLEQNAENKEEDLEDLASSLAKIILQDNRSYVGENLADAAIEEVDKKIEEENGDVQKKKIRNKPRRDF